MLDIGSHSVIPWIIPRTITFNVSIGRSLTEYLAFVKAGSKVGRLKKTANSHITIGMLNVVLVEPEIPQNTGNIARTCAATGARLHLVHPLGFDISEKAVRHAGLDYWKDVEIIEWENEEAFLKAHGNDRLFLFTTKGKHIFSDVPYEDEEDVYLLFGKESRGLREELLLEHPETSVRVPMLHDRRSLNLSNTVAIAVYEVLRHKGYPELETEGQLHGDIKW